MKKIILFLVVFVMFSSSSYAVEQDFTLFTLDIPVEYNCEEVELTQNEGYAVIVDKDDTSLLIIYDILAKSTFEEVRTAYEQLLKPSTIEQNPQLETEALIMPFVYEEQQGVAYLFNEVDAYSLYIIQGEDININQAVNSLQWK